MTGPSPKALLITAAAVTIVALGWVGGYAAAGLYLAVPFLHQRETPELFAAILVIGVLITIGLAAGASAATVRLGKLTSRSRRSWIWASAVCYLVAAAASAAALLYQHYQYLEQYGR